MPYSEAWRLQESVVQELIERKVRNRHLPDAQKEPVHHYFIFCEHPHVYTLGRNGDESNLLLDEEGLKAHQASFFKINRGGDITYHGFGQIVGYPIFDLDDFFTDIGRYVRYIEEAVIRTLKHYGIVAERMQGFAGVWLEANTPRARKICAIGVHLSRWVTMHGFAFNINTDLAYFANIVPCGITDKGVTSLAKELGREIPLQEVKTILLHEFSTLFEFETLSPESAF